MPHQCVFHSQLASDHSMLGIGQTMSPALGVQTDTPRMDLGCVSYQGCVQKHVLEDVALTQDHEGLGGWGGCGGHSWWELQSEAQMDGLKTKSTAKAQ